MKDNSPVWWNKKQLCQALGNSSPGYVEKLMRQGMPHYKVGRKVLFRPEEINAWLEQHRAIQGPDLQSLVDDVINKLKKGGTGKNQSD